MSEAKPHAPPDIVAALAALLIFQLAGEVLVTGARLTLPGFSFPGPVAGMVLLFVWLVLAKGPSASLDTSASAILRNLSLLFVPAAAGIVQYGDVIARFGLPLLLALVVSTVLTLLVTVGVFIAIAGRDKAPGADTRGGAS